MKKYAKTGLVLTLIVGAATFFATSTARADSDSSASTARESAAPSALSRMLSKTSGAPTPGALVLFGMGSLLVFGTQRKFAGH
jgi:hypothetical protein